MLVRGIVTISGAYWEREATARCVAEYRQESAPAESDSGAAMDCASGRYDAVKDGRCNRRPLWQVESRSSSKSPASRRGRPVPPRLSGRREKLQWVESCDTRGALASALRTAMSIPRDVVHPGIGVSRDDRVVGPASGKSGHWLLPPLPAYVRAGSGDRHVLRHVALASAVPGVSSAGHIRGLGVR